MVQQIINVGAADNDGTGDPLRTAFGKANANFAELYPAMARPRLVASRQASSGNAFQSVPSGAFTTIQIDAAQVDTAGGFNPATYMYVVPETGYYLIVAKLRIQDNQTGGAFSYGMGADIANVDNSEFQWLTSSSANPPRQGGLNTRISLLNKNDQLRLYAYMDRGGTATGISAASLTLLRVA